MGIVSFRRDEMPPISEERMAELRALMELPARPITDPENPEILDFSGWMTVEEMEAYRAAKKNQAAMV